MVNPLKAEIGDAKFTTADATAKALKTTVDAATTKMNAASGTFLVDAGPIGGTVYFACDSKLGYDK